MGSRETVNYTNDPNVSVGPVQTRLVPLVADTYHKGMLLEFDSTATAYKALDSGTVAGVYIGSDARVLATAGFGDVLVAGGVLRSKLVDADGAALTLTETQIATYAQSGIYVKER